MLLNLKNMLATEKTLSPIAFAETLSIEFYPEDVDYDVVFYYEGFGHIERLLPGTDQPVRFRVMLEVMQPVLETLEDARNVLFEDVLSRTAVTVFFQERVADPPLAIWKTYNTLEFHSKEAAEEEVDEFNWRHCNEGKYRASLDNHRL